jgi:transcriptional regulator with XRE-family HTH domain
VIMSPIIAAQTITKEPVSRRELLAYSAEAKGEIFRQIRELLNLLRESGFTQKNLADKIGIDPGQLSRQLKGDFDLRLETLSDLARGLDCRLDVKLSPIAINSQVFVASTVTPLMPSWNTAIASGGFVSGGSSGLTPAYLGHCVSRGSTLETMGTYYPKGAISGAPTAPISVSYTPFVAEAQPFSGARQWTVLKTVDTSPERRLAHG